jgi:hypothetical protein
MDKFIRTIVIACAIAMPALLSAATASAQTTAATDPTVLAAQNQQAIADTCVQRCTQFWRLHRHWIRTRPESKDCLRATQKHR